MSFVFTYIQYDIDLNTIIFSFIKHWSNSNETALYVRRLPRYLQDMSLFLMQIFFGRVFVATDIAFYFVMVIFPYLSHRFFSWHSFLEVQSICRGCRQYILLRGVLVITSWTSTRKDVLWIFCTLCDTCYQV